MRTVSRFSATTTLTTNAFTWAQSVDDVAVASYEIYRNGSFITSTSGSANSYVDSGLASSTGYSYYVKAVDGDGLKTQSNVINMRTLTPNQAPNPFILLNGSNTITSNSFTWTNTGDDAGVTSYEVYRNGSLVGTTAGNANSYNASSVYTPLGY